MVLSPRAITGTKPASLTTGGKPPPNFKPPPGPVTRQSNAINKGGVTYKGDPWHRECFTCTNCDTQLAGQKFTSKDDKPYCADCFGELFAKKCCRCTKPITGIGGTKFISFEDRHWHSSCFNCYQCNTSLVGRGFLTKEMDILCPQCGR